MKLQAFPITVLDELLDGGLDQANAPVVAVQLDVADQILDRLEPALILLAGDHLDLIPLVERHLRVKISDDQRDRLAVIAVGRVADQPCPSVRSLANQQHG